MAAVSMQHREAGKALAKRRVPLSIAIVVFMCCGEHSNSLASQYFIFIQFCQDQCKMVHWMYSNTKHREGTVIFSRFEMWLICLAEHLQNPGDVERGALCQHASGRFHDQPTQTSSLRARLISTYQTEPLAYAVASGFFVGTVDHEAQH